MDSQSLDPHLTTKIVTSYVRHNTVEAAQVSDLITSVHKALGQVGRSVQARKFPLLLCRCGNLFATNTWFASIAATGPRPCVGISRLNMA